MKPTRPTAAVIDQNLPKHLWTPKPTESLLENAKELYGPLAKKIISLQGRKLPADKHKALKEEVSASLKTINQDAHTVLAINRYLQEARIAKLAEEIQNLPALTLQQKMLRKFSTEGEMRNESHKFGEAWLEIQITSMLETTLLHMEIQRRKVEV